ncbi:hypothetical protein MAPG_00426 [Magnaporthiopsis poae ATCC 64411]|uniref:Uncharacterized protein n=1 Tax=Magnaporthiopsis poae (strain ATCC 64411 / 73-15) TaxID=644358 RepID=A0A0C4DKZ4_MAGP6|nr:hypothetical protein MAPG_00426 [Magnaporthiopsis poae ATCC 64411]
MQALVRPPSSAANKKNQDIYHPTSLSHFIPSARPFAAVIVATTVARSAPEVRIGYPEGFCRSPAAAFEV